MEVCQSKIVDQLFSRRRHFTAAIQHHSDTEDCMAHHLLDYRSYHMLLSGSETEQVAQR
jgi:hypothetical protein